MPPEADLEDIESAEYPEPIDFPPIQEDEIAEAIRQAPADKAPGEDGIPNKIWRILAPVITPALQHLFNACIRLGYNPEHFQQSVTVALRKEGERDFRILDSYRPVALLNTLGKFLEFIMATRLSYIIEEHGLLPKTHFGGRKGISVDHVIQHLLGTVHGA
jgi:hypothetical protein